MSKDHLAQIVFVLKSVSIHVLGFLKKQRIIDLFILLGFIFILMIAFIYY